MESHQEENRNLLPTNVMEVAPLRRSLHAKIAIAVMASLSVIAIFVFATTDTTGVMPYATNLLSGINIFNTWRDGYHNHGTPGINGNWIGSLAGMGASCGDDAAIGSIGFHREVREENCFEIFWQRHCQHNNYGWMSAGCNNFQRLNGVDVVSRSGDFHTHRSWSGSLIYLDRQHFECPGESFVRYMKINKEWYGDIYLEYSCITYNAVRSECSVHDSGMQYAANELIYIDRQHTTCPEGKAFIGFRGKSNGWDHLSLEATCCKADANAPTLQPTDAPVTSPTHSPTDQPIAEPTRKPHAEPTHSPTDEPVAEPTDKPTMFPTINKKPLVCKKRLTKSAKHYEDHLPPGCAIIALNDIAKEDYGSSKAVLVCGSVDFSRDDMEAAEVIKKGDFKGHSVSYFAVGEGVKITYFTGSNFDGESDSFEEGDKAIMDHRLGGELLNDRIHSVQISTDFYANSAIPTECPSLNDM